MSNQYNIQKILAYSWKHIAIVWPLQNFVSANPLKGLEEIPFDQAVAQANILFEQKDIPESLQHINRLCIKWLQQYFDDKQATIAMPGKEDGLYQAWLVLAMYDEQLHSNDSDCIQWLQSLPSSSEGAISICLQRLGVEESVSQDFITVLLSTLPGWAAYVQYCQHWSDKKDQYVQLAQDYTAMRLVMTVILWPHAKELLNWYKQHKQNIDMSKRLAAIKLHEKMYQESLQNKLTKQQEDESEKLQSYDAQFMFCIDTRSEPFRRSLEQVGNYQTYSCAGFFSIPMSVQTTSKQVYASCPVLLQPKHIVSESVVCSDDGCNIDARGNRILLQIKQFYQSMKYTFIAPFVLVEMLGVFSGVWMLISTLSPVFAHWVYTILRAGIRPFLPVKPSLKSISLQDQCRYVESTLRTIGLVDAFAPLVVVTGHASTTRNNSFATALDCGACGGRHGGSNARTFAAMVNSKEVRAYLYEQGIIIPDSTQFVGAQHDTTTDTVEIYDYDVSGNHQKLLQNIKRNLIVAGKKNVAYRMKQFDASSWGKQAGYRSVDWAQVRPEWGLANNASFIIGSRSVTEGVDLEGRTFLHSYNWKQDKDGTYLTTILTAPVIVAQWINAQYLFSTMNNVAYGAGSKVTLNFTGKFGVMQGNASDLMHGLSLQSVYKTDTQAYHTQQRLHVVVYAPYGRVQKIIQEHKSIQKLVQNKWVILRCYDVIEHTWHSL